MDNKFNENVNEKVDTEAKGVSESVEEKKVSDKKSDEKTLDKKSENAFFAFIKAHPSVYIIVGALLIVIVALASRFTSKKNMDASSSGTKAVSENKVIDYDINPFDKIDVKFTGYNGTGVAVITNNNEGIISDLNIEVSKSKNLTNTEGIVLKITDADKYPAYTFEELEHEYIVEGLKDFNIDEFKLSDSEIAELSQCSKKILDDYNGSILSNLGISYTSVSADIYLASSEDKPYYNGIYFVYRTDFKGPSEVASKNEDGESSDDEDQTLEDVTVDVYGVNDNDYVGYEDTYCQAVLFRTFKVNDDGSYTVDTDTADLCGSPIDITDTGVYILSFYDYASFVDYMDGLGCEYDVIQKGSADMSFEGTRYEDNEGNIEETVSDVNDAVNEDTEKVEKAEDKKEEVKEDAEKSSTEE